LDDKCTKNSLCASTNPKVAPPGKRRKTLVPTTLINLIFAVAGAGRASSTTTRQSPY
jgi:hypothetical protein